MIGEDRGWARSQFLNILVLIERWYEMLALLAALRAKVRIVFRDVLLQILRSQGA